MVPPACKSTLEDLPSTHTSPPIAYCTRRDIDLFEADHDNPKGVYLQSDGILAIVNIYASKGFVDLWLHLSFPIFAIFDLKIS